MRLGVTFSLLYQVPLQQRISLHSHGNEDNNDIKTFFGLCQTNEFSKSILIVVCEQQRQIVSKETSCFPCSTDKRSCEVCLFSHVTNGFPHYTLCWVTCGTRYVGMFLFQTSYHTLFSWRWTQSCFLLQQNILKKRSLQGYCCFVLFDNTHMYLYMSCGTVEKNKYRRKAKKILNRTFSKHTNAL